MSEQKVSDSPLAWSWVIEALASSGGIDLNALHDLIETHPSLADNLSKETREMVTLKCSEALNGPTKVLKICDSLSSDKEDCVLQRLLDLESVLSLKRCDCESSPTLRKGVSDKLEREVHALIERRKASLSKCVPEQLQQNGDLFQENCLKRERSCLQTQNGNQDCTIDVQSGVLRSGKKLRHDDGNGSDASAVQKSFALIPYDMNHNSSDVSREDNERHVENSSISDDLTELDVCVKCNKGGEVLICRVNSCPVVVHERCLGLSESIDDRDDFICPFCACSSAQSEYDEAKKKLVLTKGNLSLFVGGNSNHQSKGFKNVDVNAPRKGRDERPLKGKGDFFQEHQPSTDRQHISHLAKGKGAEYMTAKKCELQKGNPVTPIEHFHYAGLHGGHRKGRPPGQPYCQSKNASCASSANLNRTPKTENHTASPTNDELSPQSCPKLDDQMKGASSSSPDGCGGTMDYHCVAPLSEYSPVFRSGYSTRTVDRRMKVFWTEEEVEMLKEGMKQFSSMDMKVIPWKSILEFGSSVFRKGRTAVDLKDKWRNLVKANPELR